MTGHNEKASHYISLLDAARVNASWSELPELIRKVNKHAPQHKVLIQTATAEHEVATRSSTSIGRPVTRPSPQAAPLDTLSSTLQADNSPATEYHFQGKTCLIWSRWIDSETNDTTADFDTIAAARDFTGKTTSTWTKICMVKTAYIEGMGHVQNDQPGEAESMFNVGLVHLRQNQELVLSTPQLAYWTEQLLAQLAIGSSRHADSNTLSSAQVEAFRYWSTIASKTRETPSSTFRNSTSHVGRLPVWTRYYEYLSSLMGAEVEDSSTVSSNTRSQQSIELRKVERAYETELLRTTKFPTATETNEKVERWVEQAIRNWQLLCGSQWTEAELGEGGRNAIGRNMLDILYRAATKTFHSTLILRRLFQVHLSLSEFDLAFRAFDTYIELVDRAQIRVEKSGTPEPGQESAEAVLCTISEAILGLCKFGRQSEARKAYLLSHKLEDWLVAARIEDDEAGRDSTIPNGHNEPSPTRTNIDAPVLQFVYRAIGTSKAYWARWTPASEDRSRLQAQALSSLKKACAHNEPDIETLYAMSLLLAETRDISGAIRAAKKALASSTTSNKQSPGWAIERKLISQWHLLALLLSSRQDLDSAAKSCVAAFEQFASGDVQLGPGRNSSISSNIETQFDAAVSGFAGEMECDELQKIIEVRITELALTELIEGPEEAVNSCNELLSLFSRLFAHVQVPLETSASTRTLVPPKSSAGTVKTARTSIFGHRKHENTTEMINEKSNDLASIATNTTRPSTRATQAPIIQVTTEDDQPLTRKHRFRKSHDSSHSRTSTITEPQKPSNSEEAQQRSSTYSLHTNQGPLSSHPHNIESTPSTTVNNKTNISTHHISQEHVKSADSRKELPEIEHNLGSHKSVPPPTSHNEQPPQQDVRLPIVHPFTSATSPTPRAPKAIAQRQALTILTKVWLVIATLYRRASMFEDSREASEEASKAATKIEALVGAIDHSARAFAEAGWGANSKSSDEVWADVYCERGDLQLAIHKRKVTEGKSTNNEEVRAAVEHYEQCLMYMPNHASGIIGLSNILLDSYERKIDLERRAHDSRLNLIESEAVPNIAVTTETNTSPNGSTRSIAPDMPRPRISDEDLKKTPENLNRIAARDRAYGLLSTLTKSGAGWDNSEAWFALARAHELGGEVEKAKSVLWWCIELEDSKPIRHWRNLGYSL